MKESYKEFRYKKKTNWSLTIALTIWTFGLVVMIAIFTYNLATTPSRISDLIIVLLIMILIASIAVNYLRWQIIGQEVLTFTNDCIEVKNIGTFFTNYQCINYDEIENIKFEDDGQRPYFLKVWEIGGGKILIEYLGRNRRFGRDLNHDEAVQISNEMMEEFKNRKKHCY